MKKRKWKILIILSIVFVGALSLWYWNYQEKERVQLRDEERELRLYIRTADTLRMEIDYRNYEKTRTVKDIVLTPTIETERTTERWEAVSQAFPSIKFPQEEVEEGDWVQVCQRLLGSEGEMREVVVSLASELPEGETMGGVESLNIYVQNGVIQEGNFEEMLKEKGVIK
ncbi:Uncharacterised protein [Niallia circulans]|uniref:hypothetical protein n=1 Tax=Shouchella clausii TaxID=79880 RepID=UPI000BA6F2D6|nr:hypothetical protein [Shouchella clausii]MCM3549246.1 hypothetical protein [Shouchella clausii]PAF14011.1 hypothetical protein CHH59_11205 [Shouchella clausii]SPU21301.1 Uncharacterised protein [Niallia circulans]